MSQTKDVVETLKKLLREQRLTYRDVAKVLTISESSVKRLFSEKDFTLQRLDKICELMGISLSELFYAVEKNKHLVSRLTLEQEKMLVSDNKLLLVAVCIVNGWTFDEILESYLLSEHEVIKYLATLDRLKLIELLPNNRVKLLISSDFQWIRRGPINQFFNESVKIDFLNCEFNDPGEIRLFASGMLSKSSNAVITKKLESVVMEFHQLHRQDQSLSLNQRFGSSILLAMRPWELESFESLRINKNKKF